MQVCDAYYAHGGLVYIQTLVLDRRRAFLRADKTFSLAY